MTKRNLIAAVLFGGLAVVSFAIPAHADPCASVKREMAYGRVALKQAKDQAGFLKSAKEFEAAARKAPGCAQVHFNMGVIYEKAEEFDKARKAFETYLRLSPSAADAATVEEKIYELEYLAREYSGGKSSLTARNASPWDGFAGNWCEVGSCDHPKWGYVFRATVQGDVLELKFKGRTGQGQGLADFHKTFRATISPDGKLKGTLKYGDILLAHPTCSGRDFGDQYDVLGEFKKGDVMDAKGRTISGGAIIFRYREWQAHTNNYSRCTLDRSTSSYSGKAVTWSHKTVMFRRAN